MPSCDQTGTPSGFDGFRHFTSSTTSGSACLMSVRRRASMSPRQSFIDLIRASNSRANEVSFESSAELVVLRFMALAIVGWCGDVSSCSFRAHSTLAGTSRAKDARIHDIGGHVLDKHCLQFS